MSTEASGLNEVAFTIHNSGGSVTVSGGNLSAKGRYAYALRSTGGSVTISGGNLSAEGNNAFAVSCANPKISRENDSSTPIIIKGQTCAMGSTPDLSGYPNVGVAASLDYSGSPVVAYNAEEASAYRYLKFEPAVPLTGTVTISSTTKYGETLTAVYTGGNNSGALSYQWNRGKDNIEGATGNTYVIVQEDIGQTLTCVVTSSVQTGSVSSNATTTIEKADGPAITEEITVEGCTTPDNNDGKLIGVTTAMEYKKFEVTSYTAVTGGAITVTGSAITGLPSGRYMVRYAETDTHTAGPDSYFDIPGYQEPPVTFIPVTNIAMTNGASVQAGTNLTLTGTITPGNATNQTIIWSVEDANGTRASIIGDTFRATSAGSVTVKATVVNGLAIGNDYTRTFTITVTAVPAPAPTPGSGSGSASGNTEKSEGKVEKDQQKEKDAPAANMNNSSEELKASVLTPEEQRRVESGEDARIILKVTDISASVSDAGKKLIQDKLAEENGVSDKEAAEIPVLYIDLTLYKQVGSQEETKVTETKGKISISIEVPEELRIRELITNTR